MNKHTTAEYIRTGFKRIDHDLTFLMECLREVLSELNETAALENLPWLPKQKKRKTATPADNSNDTGIEQAYSIAFQLLNMVEENAAAHTRRLREIEHGLSAEHGLFGHRLAGLKKDGLKDSDITKALPHVRVEPVLTAHPTEAKRSSVLEQHRAIFRILSTLDYNNQTPSEQKQARRELKTALERLWRSGEILLEKPDVSTERRGVIFYLREVFPQALQQLDIRFRNAWEATGFSPKKLSNPHLWPRLRFGTWVGGDRDGHPFVTAEVTQESLAELRLNAIVCMHRKLGDMADQLPLSSHFQKPTKALLAATKRLRGDLGKSAENIAQQYNDEPWRQFALMVQSKLPLEVREGERIEISEETNRYKRPSELDADLLTLHEALITVGAETLSQSAVWPVRRALDVFGFHLAALDIRQNSTFHDKALSQILVKSGLDAADFADWDEQRRLDFLNKELLSPRPFLYDSISVGPEADAVLACFRVIKNHITQYGIEGVGSIIVSMTRSLSDLLVVYVLAREAGLMIWSDEGLVCGSAVVPLFETAEDLERSPGLIRDFLKHPVTKRTLLHLREERVNVMARPQRRPVQQVMIGYSDSNKDCGIFASQWTLHQAQHDITQAGYDQKTKIRFFHGRGGTISRGAGPTHRFLGALPAGTIQGDLRVTEQGETIAQKYANLNTATYNLELLLAGVTDFSARDRILDRSTPREHKLCSFVAEQSQKAYEELIHDTGFMDFYSEATPIDVLEASSIGSRPARRSGRKSLDDLRAIPWVFSWNQCRYYLPGWYGVGAGLDALRKEDPSGFTWLCKALRKSAFLNYVLTNVETNLASADKDIMRDYARLVTNPKIRSHFSKKINHEFNLTQSLMSELFGGSVEKRRPRMLKTLQLRADALRTLHAEQIELLSEWRSTRQRSEKNARKLLPKILLSVNAIASGLRTTG
ncbi:MAG: phosphoenolpyruvate carboxylase [Chthoniobacterales bacterium]